MFFSRFPHWLEAALTYGPALLLAAVALRLWRHYWSMRFWLGAAVLYWLIPWGSRAIFNAGNGAGIADRSVPAVLVEPFYVIGEFSWLLLALLMGLGLLSFHPATRWVDTARYRNVVVAGCSLLMALPLGGVAYRATQHRIAPPLDPRDFYRERATATSLKVVFEPTREVFGLGEAAFRIAVTNVGTADLHLNELPINGVLFRPQPFFHFRRAPGHLIEWGETLRIPADQELLAPSETRVFVIERSTAFRSEGVEDDRAFTPGDYTAFVAFFLQKERTFQKAVSNVIHFRIAPPRAD